MKSLTFEEFVSIVLTGYDMNKKPKVVYW